MKRALSCGGALAAALIAIAVMGAGSASATVLCNTATNPCVSVYPVETALSADQSSKNSILELVKSGESTELSRCSGEKLAASISNAGSALSPVVASATLEPGECEGPPKTTLKFGPLEINHIEGTNDGTVTAGAVEFTVNVSGLDCKWNASNVNLGTLKGGSDHLLEVNILMARNSICYPEYLLRWTATFTFTSPSTLYVEPS